MKEFNKHQKALFKTMKGMYVKFTGYKADTREKPVIGKVFSTGLDTMDLDWCWQIDTPEWGWVDIWLKAEEVKRVIIEDNKIFIEATVLDNKNVKYEFYEKD